MAYFFNVVQAKTCMTSVHESQILRRIRDKLVPTKKSINHHKYI